MFKHGHGIKWTCETDPYYSIVRDMTCKCSAVSSANSHSHLQFPVSALSIMAIQYVQGTQDNVEDGREDIVPMDISPEPSRTTHQSRIAGIEKGTRTRTFTTCVRLFGRDLGNGSISPSASCESGATIASYVRVVPGQAHDLLRDCIF